MHLANTQGKQRKQSFRALSRNRKKCHSFSFSCKALLSSVSLNITRMHFGLQLAAFAKGCEAN
ncbi:hypothetical protein CR513_61572, partial [Mucuna pruriens]